MRRHGYSVPLSSPLPQGSFFIISIVVSQGYLVLGTHEVQCRCPRDSSLNKHPTLFSPFPPRSVHHASFPVIALAFWGLASGASYIAI